MKEPSPDEIETVEEILSMAEDGADIGPALSALPETLQEQVHTVLEGRRMLVGLPAPLLGGNAGPAIIGEAVVAGRYRIQFELARGGMGVVYLALDEHTQRRVVVKVMTLDKAWNQRLRTRFEREARALKKIHRHPNVVSVLEAGNDPHQGPYLVMEHVQGRTLLSWIHEHRRLEPRRAAEIARDTARGLAVVHRQGLIHRDVKPSNVMIATGGRAKLVDFGLAKDTFLTTITKTGQILGTCYYMAPEQWDEEVREDLRCDIFALGGTLYHMLVGQPPFTGDDVHEVREEILFGEYDPPEEVAGPLPGDLALVLHQMLASDRRYRYARMDDVADDLDRVLRGEPCRVPCLTEEARGVRHPLFPGKRWTLGRDAGCHVTLSDPTVSRQHAEVRAEDGGYVLRDLASSYGTTVEERRIETPHRLTGGERVAVGDVVLAFCDPHNRPDAGRAFDRAVAPDPVVRLLVELEDLRVAASLLEELQPDPGEVQTLRDDLTRRLGPAAGELVERAARARAARARADLVALIGHDPGGVDGLLAWWDHARHGAGTQLVARRPGPPLRLTCTHGAPIALDGPTEVRIGRDPRCHLTVDSGQVSRLHASLFRLHRRWYVRDEGSSQGSVVGDARVTYAFVDPGARLRLADVELTIERAPARELPSLGSDHVVVPASVFEEFLEQRHPAVAAALAAFLEEDLVWIEAEGAAHYPDQPPLRTAFVDRLRQVYAQRAELARSLLPSLPVTDSGPQLFPAGWLAATRA